ncbi:hypothetical protein [Nannocystis bainbridge]|uniref:DUF4149 domain-containing protein n=1 Tax=Nannocystis bainbridge TaxID=2995303 RepID=A0ABT5EC69_9BACT|nr:hypothetical protein [Nannocystis bainbridge]MDC0723461.1 hypothetical protein [Nannocystis bainbridge]
MNLEAWLQPLIWLAGVGQIALALASLAIPRQLGWRLKLAGMSPLLRQMFWVYAAYILGTNLAFGLVSALAPASLLDGSPLAAAVCTFIAIYWLSRVVVQWTYFDLTELPRSRFNTFARVSLELAFVALTVVYAAAAYTNGCAPRADFHADRR